MSLQGKSESDSLFSWLYVMNNVLIINTVYQEKQKIAF